MRRAVAIAAVLASSCGDPPRPDPIYGTFVNGSNSMTIDQNDGTPDVTVTLRPGVPIGGVGTLVSPCHLFAARAAAGALAITGSDGCSDGHVIVVPDQRQNPEMFQDSLDHCVTMYVAWQTTTATPYGYSGWSWGACPVVR